MLNAISANQCWNANRKLKDSSTTTPFSYLSTSFPVKYIIERLQWFSIESSLFSSFFFIDGNLLWRLIVTPIHKHSCLSYWNGHCISNSSSFFLSKLQPRRALSCCVSGGQKVSRVAKSPIDWNHWLNAAAASTVYKKAAPQSTTAGQLHTSIRIENWVSFAAVLHHVERKADQFQPYWMKAA